MFNIYLCGGMGKFGKENFDIGNEWRAYFKEKIEDGYIDTYVCNPNDHFNFKDERDFISDHEVMEYDLYKVRNSDLVVVNFNDPQSIGSAMELAIAYEKKIPILGLCEHNEELHPWLKTVCNRIFTDREELFLYLGKHYLEINRNGFPLFYCDDWDLEVK